MADTVVDLIVHNISELATPTGGFKRGSEMKNIDILKNAWFAVTDGKFSHIGTGEYDKSLICCPTLIFDASNCLVTPGLIDAHTHLIHGGSREHELKMKLEGVPYLDILKAGGGILSTVEATRKACAEELFFKGYSVLDTMLTYGVTTIESKSGYGLDHETELKQLLVAHILDNSHPVDIVHTFLGAHAVPKEYKDNKKAYIDEVKEMMDCIKTENLAEFVDVFCEDAVFTHEESKDILEYAKSLGFKLKIHADEIVDLGGASLAAELGCVSADHLMATGDKGISSLASSDTVANLLVATSFNLNKDYARGRVMIDKGCIVSISTDYNPGSCPSENIQFAMYLAASKVGLLPEEVLTAVTINAAKAIARDNEIGSIEVGKNADFVIYVCNNLNYVFYNFGKSHVNHVFKNGKQVVRSGQII